MMTWLTLLSCLVLTASTMGAVLWVIVRLEDRG